MPFFINEFSLKVKNILELRLLKQIIKNRHCEELAIACPDFSGKQSVYSKGLLRYTRNDVKIKNEYPM